MIGFIQLSNLCWAIMCEVKSHFFCISLIISDLNISCCFAVVSSNIKHPESEEVKVSHSVVSDSL